MKIMIINGPNLNMLGIREKDIYGKQTYQDLLQMINDYCKEHNIEVVCLQSNHEGQLVDYIQQAYFDCFDGVVINPGGYTHTSVAILDAIKAIKPIPCVEVHISDINERESFRQISYPSKACVKQIKGHGFKGYIEAIEVLVNDFNS